jgi:hypothetical protein
MGAVGLVMAVSSLGGCALAPASMAAPGSGPTARSQPPRLVTPGPDGLTVTSGDEIAAPLPPGVFAGDSEALAAAVRTVEEYMVIEREIFRSGDPNHGDLGKVLTPALELEARRYLDLVLDGRAQHPDVALIEHPFIVGRTDHGDFATVEIAYCQVNTDVIRAFNGTEDHSEWVAGLISSSGDAAELRIQTVLPWRGEAIC